MSVDYNHPHNLSSVKNQPSSKVSYRQSFIPRQLLMEMRKTLLDKCEEVIDYTYWPFGKNGLTTAKIFNDLVQYHNEQHKNDGSLQVQHLATEVDASSSKKLHGVSRHHQQVILSPPGKYTAGLKSVLTGYTASTSKQGGQAIGIAIPNEKLSALKNTTMFHMSQATGGTILSSGGGANPSFISSTPVNPPQGGFNQVPRTSHLEASMLHPNEKGTSAGQEMSDVDLKLPNI